MKIFISSMRVTLLLLMIANALIGCTNQSMSQTSFDKQTPLPIKTESDDNTPKIIEAKAPIVNSQYIKLENFIVDNQGNNSVAKPGQLVQASVHYTFLCPNCKASHYQIIIGLARRSAQACIYDGQAKAQGSANFALKLPAKPGIYDVRFRGLQAENCDQALKVNWHADNSPTKENTIASITVTKKATYSM